MKQCLLGSFSRLSFMKLTDLPDPTNTFLAIFASNQFCYKVMAFSGYLASLMCGVTFAESKAPISQSREIRKAIPVAPPSRGNETDFSLIEAARKPFSGLPASNGATGVGSSGLRGQSSSADLSEARSATTANTMHALNDKRRIGIRDKLSLIIVEDELPQRQIAVTDSGEIDVPYIGRVSVEGRTCRQVATHVKSLLEKEYYYHATVLIALDFAGGQVLSKGKYYLDGQVNRTGQYEIPVDEVLTISKAIIRAGGFTQYANRKRVRLIRKNSAKQETEMFNLDMIEVMEKGKVRSDLEVEPDDQIFVDEKFFNF